MTTFAQEPYFDDFNIDKNYLQLLFRPGYAIQTRELNQIQSTLQHQVSSFGNSIFKDGAMVIPGYIAYETKVDCIRLQTLNPTNNKVSGFLGAFVGTTITGSTSGAQALVVHSEIENGTDKNTLYVKYIKSGSVNNLFIDNEQIVNDAVAPLTAIADTSAATSFGSIATIQNGLYYIKGYFVVVSAAHIVLDKYGITPSYRVGLRFTENLVTSDDDYTLNDNAVGSYNYNAPGANRYQISAALDKISLTSTDDSNFIELLNINSGSVQSKVTTTSYSELEKTLARRTYDESGDYVVNQFKLNAKQHRNNDRGLRAASTAYIIDDVVHATVSLVDYTYKCVAAGISGLSDPSYATTFARFSDGTVTWEYTETPKYNLGQYSPTDVTNPGNEAKLAFTAEGGKAYIKGFELEKIGTTVIPVDKARDFTYSNNGVLQSYTGSYILVNGLYSIPETLNGDYPLISIYDQYSAAGGTPVGSVIGTARMRGIEVDGTIANTYKVFLFNIVMNAGSTFEANARGLYYNNAVLVDFTANIAPVLTKLNGSITNSAAGTAVTGVGSTFLTDLVVGDYITADGTNLYRVSTTITTNVGLTVGTAIASANTGVVYYKTSSRLNEPQYATSIVPFSDSYIRKVRSSDDTTVDTRYTITRDFGSLTSNGSGVITIALSGTETFESVLLSTNYLVIKATDGAIAAPVYSLSGDTKTLTISSLSLSAAYTVIGTVTKTAAERSKTLNLTTLTDIITVAGITASKISLGFSDVFKIISIKQAPAIGAIAGGNLATLDITDNFILDNGLRSTYYDISSISLKPGYAVPTGSIRIVIQYFSHGAGDYFSVDSYNNQIPYEQIPTDIRDGIDFRNDITVGGAFTKTNIGIPKRGFNISADYSTYLPRIDAISMDIKGNFLLTRGVPNVSPILPAQPDQSLLLYVIYMLPYTLDASARSFNVTVIDNKRYTMRDIGKLENRINNLEYYTSLTLLEQETKSLSVIDSLGLERYKNGFMVDSFKDHGIGNTLSVDYKCSIDLTNNEMRPPAFVKYIGMSEKNTSTAQRTASGYALTGDVITLPYTNSLMVNQQYASRVENVNPFAIFTFIGNAQFTPASDDWFDTVNLPDQIINKEGNFLFTQSMLSLTGVLGTRWNDWQTTWSGVTSVQPPTSQSRDWGPDLGYGHSSISTATFQTAITTTTQTRTGLNTGIVERLDTAVVSDLVVSSATIPFMRQKNIMFLVRGLKPNTIFYPFFDAVNITPYITPASAIVFTPIVNINSNFDYTSNVGSAGHSAARIISSSVLGDTYANGDIITGVISGATAVAVLQENLLSGVKTLYILNVKGTFQVGESISGSISGARGVITSITIKTSGGSLLSNNTGDVVGVFAVPNDSRIKFKTGAKEFLLTTSSTNGLDFVSKAKGIFNSSGILNTKQKTIESVRNATIVQAAVSDNQTLISQSTSEVGNTGWYDPLAQTFLVDQTGGAFLTKVDIFFASKDSTIPVRLQIREVINGTPGKIILPFSETVLTPDKVNLSSTIVTLPNGNRYYTDDTPTSFVFSSPVYVQDATEYCIVLMSDSNKYNVWISQLGEKSISSDRFISEQPYAGVLFKSQNASTWTADQLQDLKFAIYRAKFDISVTGTPSFVNDIIPVDTLESNPFQMTASSNIIRVWHNNHNMVVGDTVTLFVPVATYNGVPSTEITGDHVIANVDLDSYTFTSTTVATATGFFGGISGVTATANIRLDVISPSIQSQSFPNTTLSYGMKSVSSAYTVDPSYIAVLPNNNNISATSKMVVSQINETNRLSGAKSLTIVATLTSENDSISPVIDTQRVSAIGVSNRINNLSSANNVSPIDFRTLVSASANVTISSVTGRLSTSDAATKLIFLSAVIGKYITITGTTSNNTTILITDIATDGAYITTSSTVVTESPSAITMKIGEYYINENSPINSSGEAKYITKNITLANACTAFKIVMSYNKPAEANFKVYYKLGTADSTNMDAIPYTEVAAANSILTALTLNDFNDFNDINYYKDSLTPFRNIVIKVVSTTTDTAKVPRFKDFRLIALA